MTKRCQYIIVGILFLLAAYFVAQQDIYNADKKTNTPPLVKIDTTLLFQKVILPNRMTLFIQYLNQHQIRVSNNYELLLLLSNPNTRQQLHHQFQIDRTILLLHAELADLMQIKMTELDAQILLFCQRNYQNPFTRAIINLHTLGEANAESILEDIGGWRMGNTNPILDNYQLSIEDIESWISQARLKKFKIFAKTP